MPRGGNQNPPRGDPLDGWKKENLAAPKRAPQQVHNFQESVYDDPRPGPDRVPTPIPEIRISPPQPPPQPRVEAAPRGGGGGGRKVLTDEEKRACAHDDTRWPPPNTSHPKPLHLLLDEKGEKRVYYHLIYMNSTPEAKYWKKEVKSKAQFYYDQKFPSSEPIKEQGKSPQRIREQAQVDEKGRLRGAIIGAKMQRKLREISSGPRGTIWILDEESIEIWKCIESVQKASPPHKAVNLGLTNEKFEIFGLGLKGEKDHVLLVSQKVDVR